VINAIDIKQDLSQSTHKVSKVSP